MRQGPSLTAAVREPGNASPVAVADRTDGRTRRRAATILVSCALIASAVAFMVVQLVVPSSGTYLKPGTTPFVPTGLVLSPLTNRSVREGDVLVAIEGVPVPALARGLLGGWTPVSASGAEAGAAGADAADAAVALAGRWRVGETVRFDVLRHGAPVALDIALGPHPVGVAARTTWGTILFALVTLAVATLVYARRPDHAPAQVLFVSASALIAATTWSLGLRPADVVVPVGFWLFQATTVVAFMIYWTSLFHFTLVFPRRLTVARVPGVVPALYLAPLAVAAGYLTVRAGRADHAWAWLATIPPVTGPHAAAFLMATLATVAWQYRTTRSTVQRRQIRWVVLAGLVSGGAGLFLYVLPPLVGSAAVSPNLIGVIVTAFPIAIGIAVLRHQLFDIDTLLQRTLVYGLATFSVAALYIAVVAAAGTILPAAAGRWPALVATVAAAIAFQPARDRVQRGVNRWLYGERDEPAAVLARLGARLEGTLAPEDVLPTLARTVAQTLRLPYVAIVLGSDAGARIAAEFGRPVPGPLRYPLTYRGRPLGAMLVATRVGEDAFTATERDLLATIARQASVAAYAAQTTADLRRSRERLVAAREEERRRLRRDLHDGLGPALAGLALKLDAASNVVGSDREAAQRLLADLRVQVQVAVDDLRSVVHALRPPALDDLGLLGALREHARGWEGGGLAIAFEAPASLPDVPAATELAAYHIVLEAMTNVVRHAGASTCRIALRATSALEVVVEDDGRGIGAGAGRGLGLASMRERAEELGGSFRVEPGRGGGTRIRALLPLAEAS